MRSPPFAPSLTIDDLPPEFINESADGTGRQFEIWKGFLVQVSSLRVPSSRLESHPIPLLSTS